MSTMVEAHLVKTSREREDVVERQRREHNFFTFLECLGNPGVDLKNIRNDIAVRKLGALGDAGRTARVLQKRNVFGVDLVRTEAGAATDLECFAEADSLRQLVGRNHLLDAFHNEVDEGSFHEWEKISHGRHHHVLAACVGERAFKSPSKIFNDDRSLSAGVAERLVHFARSVERIDVDHDEARSHYGEKRHDVL